MSKNRMIPFGYKMEHGEITTEPREVYAVVKIFDEYIAGKSLIDIANMMQVEDIPYHPLEKNQWNRNKVKRILENKKYLGTERYPQLVDKAKFDKVNEIKTKKATNLCIVPEDMKEIRNMAICADCRKRLFRNPNGTWDCKSYRCGRFMHRVTDQMIISAVLNMLNSAIANPCLIESGGELSIYTPNGNVTRQKNEIDRLLDSPNIDYERIKAEMIRLAEIKYDCCTYDDVVQKTQYLKKQLSDRKQLNKLDIDLLKSCAEHIAISHFASISLEMINGIKLINNTERKEVITDECNSNSCDEASSDI
ncbi:MAG: recombinase family protein [Clostridia bacterium]|nr:recombinase family protein [Clostridia bacterium]